MKVDKKFNEKIQDIILYSGGKEEASKIMGVSEEIIDDFLRMEKAPSKSLDEDIDSVLKEVIDLRASASEQTKTELDQFTPASGMLDRAITFFNGTQIESKFDELSGDIDPEKDYEIGLQIIKDGQIGNYSFFIKGEDLIDLDNWESIAWEQFRGIADAWGSDIAINVNSIG